MPQPIPEQFAPFHQPYIRQVQAYYSPAEALQVSKKAVADYLLNLSVEQSLFSYAPEKWTVKEVVQHLIDAERIFGYRALCIARGEKVSLPGFDENSYAAASGASYRRWEHLVEEWIHLRESTLQLFRSLNDSQLQQEGMANGNLITPSAIGFITAGHALHHLAVLKKRYFKTN